jgi:5-methyltetrahydrofolate--homocysteine methyltransferase
MNKPITDLVAKKKLVLCDGAWGTMLFEKGLGTGECPELWNVTHREAVLAIAQGYVDAGSEIIETNTFGGNKIKLAHYGLGDRTEELNEAGAKISRKAAGNAVLVMGSPCIRRSDQGRGFRGFSSSGYWA